MMKLLHIDDKWSVQYDPNNNDRPMRWMRNGEIIEHEPNNIEIALFYALLEAQS